MSDMIDEDLTALTKEDAQPNLTKIREDMRVQGLCPETMARETQKFMKSVYARAKQNG